MRILLADDHDLVRETMAAFLMSEGQAEVDTAGTLHEALDLVTEKGAYDLVLLDYNMPGMNGLDGLARMRKANADKPVAILSGTTTRALAEEAIAEGAAGFVPKTLASKSMITAARFMAAGEVYAPFNFMQQKVRNGVRASDEPRARGASGHLPGAVEQGNRARPRPARGDGEAAREDALPETRGQEPHPCRDDRARPQHRLRRVRAGHLSVRIGRTCPTGPAHRPLRRRPEGASGYPLPNWRGPDHDHTSQRSPRHREPGCQRAMPRGRGRPRRAGRRGDSGRRSRAGPAHTDWNGTAVKLVGLTHNRRLWRGDSLRTAHAMVRLGGGTSAAARTVARSRPCSISPVATVSPTFTGPNGSVR
jgi:DNA-binding NarL/FixJ family response regulator